MNNSFQLILDKNEREMNNQWTNIMIYSKYFLRIYNPIFTYFLRQFFLFVQTENVLNFTWDSFSAKPIKLTFHTIRHFDTKQEWLQKTNAILLVDTLSKAMLHIHNISSKTQNVTVLRFIKYTSLPWEIAQGNVMISEFLFLVETMVSSYAQKLKGRHNMLFIEKTIRQIREEETYYEVKFHIELRRITQEDFIITHCWE